MNAPSDEDLTLRAQSGDRRAFRLLVERHEDGVARTVSSMLGRSAEVDDVVQEVFLRFYQTLDRFRGDAAPGTYLRRIAINRSLDVLRRRQRSLGRFFSRDDATALIQDIPAAEDGNLEQVDRVRIVRKAIETLRPNHRAVVTLRLIEGYSTKETAQMLGIPTGTVLSRLSRASEHLRGLLRPILHDDI